MAVYIKRSEQKLPVSIEEAWEFLSSPFNLKKITPEYMGFEIRSGIKQNDTMFAGQIIVYRIKLIAGISSEWVTEITHVKNRDYFNDEQRFGPYLMWHHMHKLKPVDGGVLMDDTIHYKIPFGIFGQLLHFLFIKKRLNQIFEFREKALESIFGKFPS